MIYVVATAQVKPEKRAEFIAGAQACIAGLAGQRFGLVQRQFLRAGAILRHDGQLLARVDRLVAQPLPQRRRPRIGMVKSQRL